MNKRILLGLLLMPCLSNTMGNITKSENEKIVTYTQHYDERYVNVIHYKESNKYDASELLRNGYEMPQTDDPKKVFESLKTTYEKQQKEK